MTIRHLIALLLACAGICLVAMFFLPWSARAAVTKQAPAPEPACYTIEEAVADAVRFGGYKVALIDMPAVGAAQLLMVVVNGGITVWAVLDGCMVYSPVTLLPAREQTPA